MKYLSNIDIQVEYSIKQMYQKMIKWNNFWRLVLDLKNSLTAMFLLTFDFYT